MTHYQLTPEDIKTYFDCLHGRDIKLKRDTQLLNNCELDLIRNNRIAAAVISWKRRQNISIKHAQKMYRMLKFENL